MFKLKTLTAMTASALALLGCASPTPNAVPGVSILPVTTVRHGIDANAHYQTGRYFQGQNRYERAIASYRDALAVNPRHADAHNALGIIYSSRGEPELAEREFKAAIEASPASSYLYNNLGFHYLQQGRPDQALAAFERARTLEPGNPRVAANILAARTRLGPRQDDAATPPIAAGAATGEPPVALGGGDREHATGAPTPVPALPDTQIQVIAAPSSAQALQMNEITPNVWELKPNGSAAREPDRNKAASPAAATSPSPEGAPRAARAIEIANANGIEGLARQVAMLLERDGLGKPILSNRTPYGALLSGIQYLAGMEETAARINASLPVPLLTTRAARLDRNAAVQLVLGRDFPAPAAWNRVTRGPAAGTAEFVGIRVEISNGNGAPRLAKRVADQLKTSGVSVTHLTNQKPFGQRASQIEFVPGSEQAARQLAGALASGLSVSEVAALGRNVQLRIVLGKDFHMTPQAADAGTPQAVRRVAAVN